MKARFVLLVTFFLCGCSKPLSYNVLEQPQDRILTASIGSTIFRMNKSSDLPNAYGGADIYGGKVDRGYTELKFKGFSERGDLILQITDVNKSSTENTIDRYLSQHKNISASNTINFGDDSKPDQTTFEFDLKKEKTLTLNGVVVIFYEITPYSVKYICKFEG